MSDAETPVDMTLDGLTWTVTDQQPDGSGLPYATHSGLWEIGGQVLRCYRLNTGQAVIHADDMEAFFNALAGAAET